MWPAGLHKKWVLRGELEEYEITASEHPLGEEEGLVPVPLVLAQLERWHKASPATLQEMAEALGGPRPGAMTIAQREEFERGLNQRLGSAFRRRALVARVIPQRELVRDRPVEKSAGSLPALPPERSSAGASSGREPIDSARQIQALQKAAEQRLALCELCR